MSSPLSGSSPTSIDTQLATSATFLNASSTANKPSVILPLSSSSIIPSEPTKGSLTSDDVALNVASNTAQSASAQTPSTTASDLATKGTVGNLPATTAQNASLTVDDKTTVIAPPTATSDSSQTTPSTSPTSIKSTTSSITTQVSSSASELSLQISSVTTVSNGAIPTATPSSQISSSITISSQTQNLATASQPSSPQGSPASGPEVGKEAPSAAPSSSQSVTPSQVNSSAAQPTNDTVQGPQVFSAADVAPAPSSSAATSSTASIEADNISSTQGQSQIAASQPVVPAVSASREASIPGTPISTPVSTPGAAAASVPTSVTSVTPASTSTGSLSDSILSGIHSNTVTDVAFTAPSSTGSFAGFPTDSNTLPGSLQESHLPEGSQPTGQPIADPVSSSSSPSTGTIVGGTVGGIAAAAVIVILLWFWRKRVANDRRGSSNVRGYTEKDSSTPMAQRLGLSTTMNTVKQNISEKFAPSSINMNRGNSQFLEANTIPPSRVTPTRNGGAKIPAAAGGKPKKHKGPGLSFDFGRRFNPFSDANALMSGTVPPSSSVLSNPFSDDNMVLPPPVSAQNRRSRGRSLGGIRSFHAPTVPARPHSVHRESLQSNDSFIQRRDKFRSDPFDLEIGSRLAPPGNGTPSRSSSVYSSQLQQNPHDSYTSKYVSGSSLGDWTAGRDAGSDGPSGRRDSPTIS
ncbi:hypothetical protein V8C42DRAFT_339185 [Trichoderma barbatum]